MPYVAPTAADLKARFPAFADVADPVVEQALAEAAAQVDASWIEADRFLATMLYAAHTLILDGQGTSTEAQLAGFKRLRISSLELERESSAKGSAFGDISSTSYGQRFLALRRKSHPPVAVVV